MPAPHTPEEFLAITEKSELLDKPKLASIAQALVKILPPNATASEVAAFFVREGHLTVFQSKLLLQGKWRNFFIGSKYKVLEHIGAGGMGTVFLCEHRHMKRRVAVKLLPIEKSQTSGNIERFVREAQAVARLDHPNIVRAHDVDRDGPVYYLVMEYVDGVCLQQLVEHTGPLPVDRAVNYIAQSAAGLQHAHGAGLVHRDIKPSNLLLERGGVVKILDLGLARFSAHSEQLTRQIDSNMILGTADYLSPEQARDSCVDIRADIYSLGALFYYLLTGHAPFHNGSVAQKLIFHQTAKPKPVNAGRRDIPDGVSAIVDRMLAKDAADRPQIPWDVIEALRPWLSEVPVPTDAEFPSQYKSGGSRDSMSLNRKSTLAGLSMTLRDQMQRPAGPSTFARTGNERKTMMISRS